MLCCNSAFEQGNLDLWRYTNAFIIIIIIPVQFGWFPVRPDVDHARQIVNNKVRALIVAAKKLSIIISNCWTRANMREMVCT